MEAQHSNTWDSSPKACGSQPWGYRECAQSAQLRAGTPPVLEMETAAPQLLHTAETAGTSTELQMLAERRWKRLDLEIHRRLS